MGNGEWEMGKGGLGMENGKGGMGNLLKALQTTLIN